MYERLINAQVRAVILQSRLTAARARDDESGEILPWVLLTLGLLAAVGLIVAAVNGWIGTKSGELNKY